jgi:hypothetical protein
LRYKNIPTAAMQAANRKKPPRAAAIAMMVLTRCFCGLPDWVAVLVAEDDVLDVLAAVVDELASGTVYLRQI